MSETETIKGRSYLYTNVFRPLLIIIGALSILLSKEYVSAKLLLGLLLLDYFTTDFVNKIPVPICFGIFLILTTIAVT